MVQEQLDSILLSLFHTSRRSIRTAEYTDIQPVLLDFLRGNSIKGMLNAHIAKFFTSCGADDSCWRDG